MLHAHPPALEHKNMAYAHYGEFFKENADTESSHLQPALKCWGLVVPIMLVENEFMLTIENMSIAKTKDFFMAFALLLSSQYVFNLSYSRNLILSIHATIQQLNKCFNI